MFNKFNNLTFLRLVEACYDVLVAVAVKCQKTGEAYGESIYKQAAMIWASARSDDTIYRQLRNSFMITRNEWVSEVGQVDADKVHNKAAYRACYARAKKLGMEIGYDGTPTCMEADEWHRLAQKYRIHLASQCKDMNKLFFYMPGIGFVVRADGWYQVAHTLRAQQIVLAVMGVDIADINDDQHALFDCTADKTFVFTDTIMDLKTFDREGNTTDDRLGRLNAVTRGRKDQAGYDGWAGIMAAHDKDVDAIEESFLCSKLGIRGRVKDVILMDAKLNRLHHLLKDAQGNLVDMTDDDGKQYTILNPDFVKTRSMMGRQKLWIDKVHDNRPGTWKTFHARWVHDPAALKLHAYRSLNNPECPLSAKRVAYEDHSVDKCILDVENTKYYHKVNPWIFGVSKRMSERMHDKSCSFRYVVIWGFNVSEDGIKTYYKSPQVYKVGRAKDWEFAIDDNISVNVRGQWRKGDLLGIGIVGKQYHDVLDLMGIEWSSELVLVPNKVKDWLSGGVDDSSHVDDFLDQCQGLEDMDADDKGDPGLAAVQDVTTYSPRYTQIMTINFES